MLIDEIDSFASQYFEILVFIFGFKVKEKLLRFTDFCFKVTRNCFAFFLVFIHFD
jgi:hypothetical protein